MTGTIALTRHVHISVGNTKIGDTLNVSLPPGVTCQKNVPCAKACYAKRIYRRFTSTRESWDENLAYFNADPFAYFKEISDVVHKAGRMYFRWNVSGDIPNDLYFSGMCGVAVQNPKTSFLVYTRYPFIRNIPENLHVIKSYWKGFDRPYDKAYPGFMAVDKNCDLSNYTAYLQEKLPSSKISSCPGKCTDCRRCWESGPGDIIITHIH